jgi:hypothetical protein
MNVLSSEEYKAIREFAEKSRLSAERAREELDRHVAEHDC